MAVTIDNVFIEEFTENLISLSQQRPSLLRPYVMEVAASGEGYNWDRIGPMDAVAKTTRATATPVGDAPFSRRKSIPATVHLGDLVEEAEIVQMLPDPKSAIARELAYGMNRAYDDEIISAAVGDSRDGDGVAVTLPAGQSIDSNTVDLSFDLITQVNEKFMANNIDPDVPKIWTISPAQARQLLKISEVNNIDTNAVRPLVAGKPVHFMGFDWLVSTRLQAGAKATGSLSSKTFAMTYDAIGLQVNNPLKARVQEDPSVSFAWRVYCEATFGAIRVEDEKLVVVDIDNDVG